MKSLFILSCLIFLINTRIEETSDCNYRSYDKTTYEDCRDLTTSDGKQCCVVVQAMLGKNEYFCHQFDEEATEEEIAKTVNEDFILPTLENIPGVITRARASCSKDVEPYTFNKCKAEESQSSKNFETCKDYTKDSNSDYCCLFSANMGDSDNVYFCEEINEAQAKDMNKTVNDIDSHYEMFNVKYMNCTPDLPDPVPEPTAAFGLNFNLLLLVYLLILII